MLKIEYGSHREQEMDLIFYGFIKDVSSDNANK